MSSEQPRPETPAWRQGIKATERSQSAQPAWRKEAPAAATAPTQWKRWVQAAAGVLGLVVLTGLLVWVYGWLFPPKQTALLLLGSDYVIGDDERPSLALPPNLYGWASLKAFAQEDTGVTSVMKVLPTRAFGPDAAWDKDLDGIDNSTVVLFLSLHGAVDRDGEPYLFRNMRAGADLGDKANRLYILEVLDRLERLPPEKKKVLILDATQVTAHWPSGMLHNDFARAMRDSKMKNRIEGIRNLVVLCSSDVDQRSWVSEEWRQTIFAHYVLEGLRGAADAAPDGNGNERVDAAELHRFVSRNVDKWVSAARNGARQTPFLVPDEKTAGRIELTAPLKNYKEPPGEEASGYKSPSDLAEVYKEWETCQNLQNAVPGPDVYTPHVWRQYLDTLLLYEQTVRAGSDQAGKLKNELVELQKQLREGRGRNMDCMQRFLAMPAALGLPAPWSQDRAEERFRTLWESGGPEREQLWKEWKDAEKGKPWLVQLQLISSLMDYVAQSRDRPTLEKARTFLASIDAGGNQPPAEAIFLAALDPHLDKELPPPGDVLASALQVRRLAESAALGIGSATDKRDAPALVPKLQFEHGRGSAAHPYSEYVFPWIKDKIVAADDLRRKGEDRLFATATDRKYGDTLKEEYLNKAEELYRQAQTQARAVQEALNTWHEVQALLPYYSQWLAAQRQSQGRERKQEVEDLIKKVPDLWKETHQLAHFLEDPRPENIDKATKLTPDDVDQSLNQRTQNIKRTFRELRKTFLARYRDLPKEPNNRDLPSVYLDLEDALLVPDVAADLRKELLASVRRNSRSLHLNTAVAALNPEVVGEADRKSTVETRERALRQGNLALAVLGTRWFDDDRFKAEKSSSVVKDYLDKASRAEDHWSKPLIEAGYQVGLRWQQLPGEINARTKDGGAADLQSAEKILTEAERLGRQLDGSQVRRLQRDPLREGRRLRLHNLLVWQGERTYHDHWFGDADVPYYQYAGSIFVKDAEALLKEHAKELTAPQRHKRMKAVEELSKKLAQTTRLEPSLVYPKNPDVTSEQLLTLEYQFGPSPSTGWLPEGFPVFWMNSAPYLQKQNDRGRLIEKTDGKQVTPLPRVLFKLKPLPNPGATGVDKTKVVLEGFYRGQTIQLPTDLSLYRSADIVRSQYPLPTKGGIAVRATRDVVKRFAPPNARLAIVLDCTGSMGPEVDPVTYKYKKGPYNSETTCKYHDATNALREVLEGLDEGVTVSVWVFGQALGNAYPDGEGRSPPPHIREYYLNGHLARNQPIDAAETITSIRRPEAWTRDQLQGLLNKLRALKPYNETPLVRAMYQVKKEDFANTVDGFQTMLVLTDGADNCFAKDNVLNPNRDTSISKFLLDNFKNSPIKINLIGFDVGEEELDLKNQFESTIKTLGGNYVATARNSADLVKHLKRSIKQRLLYKILADENNREAVAALREVMPEEGWPVSEDALGEGQFSCRLPKGDYKVVLQTPRREKSVHIGGGDFIDATITIDELGSLDFERVLLGRRMALNDHNDQDPSNLLTLLQNQFETKDRSMEMLLTLENVEAERARGRPLQMEPPSAIWFEVRPQGGDPATVEWSELPGYTARAWGLRLTDWPSSQQTGPLRPEVRVWVNWHGVEPGRVTKVDLPRGAGLAYFKGKTLPIAGDAQVTIEGVEIEEHEIRAGPEGEKERRSCLVVRLSCPKNQRVWIEPDGLSVEGQKHALYIRAGKYTGYFWPVYTGAEKLSGLTIYTLDALQKAEGTRMIELKASKPPGNDRRPDPIPALYNLK